MPSATLARLVSRCRHLSACAPAADGELLHRFVRTRDADAFAELLARHAGLVWGVCRRTLPQEADAEDAFQAVFLALARSARSIDPQRPLAAWLHAVAVRVSRRALGKTLRRRTSELPECAASADLIRDVSSRDLFRAVDEEIDRLPTSLRGPVVLCCLEGRARDEAADLLGCSVLAVKARLERGRQALRTALARRGIALPAAFAVVGLGTARVAAGLRERAVHNALGSASPEVVKLAAVGTVHHFGVLGLALTAIVAVGVGLFGVPSGQPKDGLAKDVPPVAKADEPKAGVDRFGDPLPDGAVRRFGTLRFRHESVAALAFTPDDKRLVAGVGREPLAVFDPADGRKQAEVGAQSANNNYGFALSPDGKQIYATGYYLTAFDLATGAKGRVFKDAVRCNTVAVSPDGKRVACGLENRGGEAMVLDAETGKKLINLNLKDLPANNWGPTANGLAFSPDGKVVAAIVTRTEQTKPSMLTQIPVGLRLWDPDTGDPLMTINPADDAPNTFAFIPGTKLIAWLGKGRVIHLWNPEAGKAVRDISLVKGDEPASEMKVSADGTRLAVYFLSGSAAVLDVATGKELRRVEVGTTVGPVALALSADGSVLAAGKLYGDASVHVWEVDSGKERLADAGHRGSAVLTMSADGKTLVSRGGGQVFHWDLATGDGKAEPDTEKDADGHIPDRDWSRWQYRAGRYRYTMEHLSGRIEVYTRDGSKLVTQTDCPKQYPRGTAVSPDGRTFAVSFQDQAATIVLWTPDERAEPYRLTRHPGAVQQMTFTHDGKYLIAGAGTHNHYPSETLFIYETATGKLVHKLPTRSAPGHLLVTADDKTLITGGLWNDATVQAWDLATGKELATMIDPAVKEPSLANPGGGEVPSIGALALSADERFLAVLTGSAGKSSVSLWDTGSWKLVKAFPSARPRSDAASLAVAPTGRSVFAAYLDSTILEWAVTNPSRTPTAAPSAARLDELWRLLGDAEQGYAAAAELLDHPAEAVALVKSKLPPATPLDPKAVNDLVRQLGSDAFREREEAGKKLAALGEAAVPLIRTAAAGDLSAEAKERAEKVLAALSAGATQDQLRARRAVAVLEWSRRPEAIAHLRTLAAGDPNARATIEAKAALKR
jgi:RNA polymerase sigma factor (sigma-70 family)